MDWTEMKLTFLLLFWVTILSCVTGYPTGAPPAQCVDGFPFHGVAPRTNLAPYAILVDEKSYSPGQQFRIAIQQERTPPIKGFAIHVRPVDGDGRAVGNWVSYDKEQVQGYSVHAYNEIDINCLTHRLPTDKQRLVFQYMAPSPSLGDLEVLVTFVRSKSIYWTRVKKIIRANQPGRIPFPPVTVSKTLEVPKFEDCGKSYGCFLYPRDCSGLDCRYSLTYRLAADGSEMQFQAMADAPDYVTMGFSADKKMGTDETVTCISTEYYQTVQHGFNLGHCNERQPLSRLTDLAVTRSGNKIFCRWSRSLTSVLRSYYNVSCSKGDRYNQGHARFEFDYLAFSYYLFVGRGSVYNGTDVIGKHDQLPIISENKIDFKSVKLQYGWQLPIVIKCHGALALAAWLGLIAIAMTTSRHFKTSLLRMNCDKPLWFQIHASFNVIGILLMGGCIALMMFHLKDQNFFKMELYYLIHGGLGLGATGLGVLQIILGICRPPLESESRSCWTWMHRVLGVFSLLAACGSIFMGVNMEAIEVWLRRRMTILVAALLGYIILWNIILEFVGCCLKPKAEGGSNSIEETAPKPPSSSGANYAYYVIFVILFLGSTVLLLLSVSNLAMA